jgi:predicted dehydrogenase
VDRQNISAKQRPTLVKFESMSTERAELEHFARAAKEKRRIAIPGGDEVHNVAVLEAIVRSAQDGSRMRIA